MRKLFYPLFTLALTIVCFGTLATAELKNPVVEGRIVSFDKNAVLIKNVGEEKVTKIPRELLVKDIQIGEFVRLELTDAQLVEIKKINHSK